MSNLSACTRSCLDCQFHIRSHSLCWRTKYNLARSYSKSRHPRRGIIDHHWCSGSSTLSCFCRSTRTLSRTIRWWGTRRCPQRKSNTDFRRHRYRTHPLRRFKSKWCCRGWRSTRWTRPRTWTSCFQNCWRRGPLTRRNSRILSSLWGCRTTRWGRCCTGTRSPHWVGSSIRLRSPCKNRWRSHFNPQNTRLGHPKNCRTPRTNCCPQSPAQTENFKSTRTSRSTQTHQRTTHCSQKCTPSTQRYTNIYFLCYPRRSHSNYCQPATINI